MTTISLTSPQDEPLDLPQQPIGLVHPVHLSDADLQAWKAQLADYDIAPPFPQLGLPAVRWDRPSLTMGPVESGYAGSYSRPLGAIAAVVESEEFGVDFVAGPLAGRIRCYGESIPHA